MKTVLLVGITGVYNYGCEAIVRGTAAQLHSVWPGARILYASPRPSEDLPRLDGSGVEVIPRPHRRYSVKNIARKALSLARVRWSPCLDSPALLDGIDAVFSIGGDIYTLLEDGDFDAALPRLGEKALRRGLPYVLWGASVGPFSGNPKAEAFYADHLRRVTLIAAREPHTIEYLARLGIEHNVRSCSDPAFCVAPEITRAPLTGGRDPTIGVNLSPLSVGFARLGLGDAVRRQAGAVEALLETFGGRVILVPHVICHDTAVDDDARYLRRVWSAVRPELRGRVELVQGDPGFIGAKRVLAGCDVVLAARMHCAINAVSAGVPTLFVAYSQKAKGVCELVYGSQEQVLRLDEFERSQGFLDRVDAVLRDREAIATRLRHRVAEIRDPAGWAALRVLRQWSSSASGLHGGAAGGTGRTVRRAEREGGR